MIAFIIHMNGWIPTSAKSNGPPCYTSAMDPLGPPCYSSAFVVRLPQLHHPWTLNWKQKSSSPNASCCLHKSYYCHGLTSLYQIVLHELSLRTASAKPQHRAIAKCNSQKWLSCTQNTGPRIISCIHTDKEQRVHVISLKPSWPSSEGHIVFPQCSQWPWEPSRGTHNYLVVSHLPSPSICNIVPPFFHKYTGTFLHVRPLRISPTAMGRTSDCKQSGFNLFIAVSVSSAMIMENSWGAFPDAKRLTTLLSKEQSRWK